MKRCENNFKSLDMRKFPAFVSDLETVTNSFNKIELNETFQTNKLTKYSVSYKGTEKCSRIINCFETSLTESVALLQKYCEEFDLFNVYIKYEEFYVIQQISDNMELISKLNYVVKDRISKNPSRMSMKRESTEKGSVTSIKINILLDLVKFDDEMKLFVIQANLLKNCNPTIVSNIIIYCIDISETIQLIDHYCIKKLKYKDSSKQSKKINYFNGNICYNQSTMDILHRENITKHETEKIESNILQYAKKHTNINKLAEENNTKKNAPKKKYLKVYSLNTFHNTHFSSFNNSTLNDNLLKEKLRDVFKTLSYDKLCFYVNLAENENGGSLSGLTHKEIIHLIENVSLKKRTSRKKKSNKNDDCYTCAICISVLYKSHQKLLICGHSFHTYCLQKWFKVKKVCPTCRQMIGVDEFPPLS